MRRLTICMVVVGITALVSYQYAVMQRQAAVESQARSLVKGIGLIGGDFQWVTFARESDLTKVKRAVEALAEVDPPWISLTLQERDIDHEMFQKIGRIPRLRSLSLRSARFRDEDLLALKSLTKLQMINVIDTPTSGAGLEHLWHLPNLREVHIVDTKVTKRDVARLRAKRPDIEFDKPEYLAELLP